MRNLKINSINGKLNLSDLPQNCIFNKVITGCGGTTVALFNDRNYVISVPTTELIINKTGLNEAGLSTITSPDIIRKSKCSGVSEQNVSFLKTKRTSVNLFITPSTQ